MPTIVELPDKTELEFPDGMDEIAMRRAIAGSFPEFASTTESESVSLPMPGETRRQRVAVEPIVSPVAEAFPAQIQRLVETQAAKTPELTGAEVEQMLMTPQIKIPNPVPQSWPITRGLVNVAKSIPEFATAPAAPEILMAQRVPLLREALDAAMGAGMVKSASQLAGEASVTGNREQMAEAIGTGLLGAGMVAGPHVAPILANEIAARRVGAPNLTAVDVEAFPDRTRGITIPPVVEQAQRGGLFQPRGLEGARVIEAPVPRGPKPVVPATPPEPERGMSVLQEIRAKGADTKEKIRALFPQLSRETAAKLRDQAFPREKVPDNLSRADVDRLFLDRLNEESNAEIDAAERAYAAKIRQIESNVRVEPQGTPAQRVSEEAGAGDQLQPAATGKTEEAPVAKPTSNRFGANPAWLNELSKPENADIAELWKRYQETGDANARQILTGGTRGLLVRLEDVREMMREYPSLLKPSEAPATLPPEEQAQARADLAAELGEESPAAVETAPLDRSLEIEKQFDLSPAEAAVFNNAIERVRSNPKRWTTLAEGVQKEALRLAAPSGVSLERTGNLALAKKIAYTYLREASAGVKALEVGEPEPTTRSTPPPARAEEGARETATPPTPISPGPGAAAAASKPILYAKTELQKPAAVVGVTANDLLRDRGNDFTAGRSLSEEFGSDWKSGKYVSVPDYGIEIRIDKPESNSAHNITYAKSLYELLLAGKPLELEAPKATEPVKQISVGPGAAAAGEPGSYSAIEQLSDRLRTVPSTSKVDSLSLRQRLADKLTAGRNAFVRAVGRARAVTESLKSNAGGMRNVNDVERTVGVLDRDLQTSAGDSRNLGKVMERTYKDANMRRAAALYIDVGGDVTQLRDALAALPRNTRPEIRRAIETAANLNEEGHNLADFLREYYGIREQEAVSADIFKQGLTDYYTHIWKKVEDMPNDLRTAVTTGKVNTYWQFARHRKLSTFLEGIMEGKVPELDPAKVIPYYNFTLDRAIASRNFIGDLSKVEAEDGRPVLAATGTRQEISGTEYAVVTEPGRRARRVYDSAEEAQESLGEGEMVEPRQKDLVLIRPQGKNAALAGYRSVDHPAMRKWKWAETDANGKTTLYEGELQVHPDHYERVARIMERSRLTPSRAMRGALRVGGEIKAAKFGLASTFHQIHVGLHAAFHWTNPFRVSNKPWVDATDGSINFSHPFVRDAIQYGHVKVAGEPHEIMSMAEGILQRGALIHKIPFIGPWSRVYSEWLFNDYIPKLKLNTYENALPRNMKAYEGKYTPEQIKARVGDAVNNAYGELNRLFLGKYGRDPRFQRALQLGFLAPDFGEARLRFVGKALTKGGHEERLALATMFTTLYLTARIGNYLSHGNPEWDWKKAFSVKQGDHWYSVRSVIGDVDHALADFRNFATVRLSPASRTLLEYLGGRDAKGQKRTGSEQVADFMRQFVPVSLQGLAEPDRPLWDSFASAMGLQTRRENAQQEVRLMVNDWMKKSRDPVIKARLARLEKETFVPSEYAPLRRALRDHDMDGARAEYRKLRKIKTAAMIEHAMRPSKPFTDSIKDELKFRRSLDSRQRTVYARARRDREQQYQRFLTLTR